MRTEIYQHRYRHLWDSFVGASKNGTFLFRRDYMEYHADRFRDHSVLVWEPESRLVAVLPANHGGDRLISHEGLTYGGFITDGKMTVPLMLAVFDKVLTFLQECSFQKVIYKAIPHIHHKIPAEEDRYALFLCGARVTRCGVLTVIDSYNRCDYQERRLRGARKAAKYGLQVKLCNDFGPFWSLLTEVLWETHKSAPVHSLQEIELLRSRFLQNIKLYGCFAGTSLVGGVVVYESDRSARAQYIAANARGKELGALDLVFKVLIEEIYRNKHFLDFGTSDEEDGRRLNRGLVEQKEGFGGRMVAQDQFEIDLTNWRPGRLLASTGHYC